MYSIDFKKLIAQLLHSILPDFWQVFIQALLKPLHTKYVEFTNARNYTLKGLGYNSQVCYLEKALNDYIDPSERRIYIEEGDRLDAVILQPDELNAPVMLPVIIHTESNYANTGVDFIVNIPELTASKYNQLIAVLNTYKLVGKTYELVVI